MTKMLMQMKFIALDVYKYIGNKLELQILDAELGLDVIKIID